MAACLVPLLPPKLLAVWVNIATVDKQLEEAVAVAIAGAVDVFTAVVVGIEMETL